MSDSTKNLIIGILIILVILKTIDFCLSNKKRIKRKNKNLFARKIKLDVTYRKKNVLTNNEMLFYKNLKNIAKYLNLIVLVKVRLADLIDVAKYKNNKEYYTYFGKIKSKHIDFALANPEDLEIRLIIELDDYTHNFKKNRENDEFKNNVLKETGYKLLRVYNADNLEKKINRILKSQNIE